MAEDTAAAGDGEAAARNGNGENDGSDNGDSQRKPAKKRGKLLLFAGIGAFVVLAIGGGVGWATGILPSLLGIPVEIREARIELGKPVTYDLPEIKADLKTGACRAPLLRALVSVQLLPKDVPVLQASEMRVRDRIIAHLRDIERQELVGKEGTERLRFDIVEIINQEIQPATAHTVFFRDLLLQ